MVSQKTIEGVFTLLIQDPGVTAAVREAVIRALDQGQADANVASVRVVSFAEAAGRLGVSVGTVRNMVRRGRLKAVRGSADRLIGVREASLQDV